MIEDSQTTFDPWENWPTYQEWLDGGGPERAEKQRQADFYKYPQKGRESAQCPVCMKKKTRKSGSSRSFICKKCE